MKKPLPYCVICGKRCQPWEENTDGTYGHAGCLATQAVRPERKKEEKDE